jgi:hypothetical protein
MPARGDQFYADVASPGDYDFSGIFRFFGVLSLPAAVVGLRGGITRYHQDGGRHRKRRRAPRHRLSQRTATVRLSARGHPLQASCARMTGSPTRESASQKLGGACVIAMAQFEAHVRLAVKVATMANRSLDVPVDSTRMLVNRMLDKRRSMRVPIIAGGVAVAVLLAAMLLRLGSHREINLDVAGPVYVSKTHTDAAAATPAEPNGAQPPAHVEVVLNTAGQIWLDGRSLGSARKHDLDLKPGTYVLVGKLGTRTMTQKLTVASRDSLRVEFQSSRVRVLREDLHD